MEMKSVKTKNIKIKTMMSPRDNETDTSQSSSTSSHAKVFGKIPTLKMAMMMRWSPKINMMARVVVEATGKREFHKMGAATRHTAVVI